MEHLLILIIGLPEEIIRWKIILAGTHSVTVTDVNNCSETMSITLVEPDALVVNGSSTGDYNPFPGGFDITCKGLNDGECYAEPYGGVPGTPGYMYSWSGPINGQISNLDQIVNLYVGTYSVTVTDANGCTDVQTFTLTEPDRRVSFSNSYD